MKRADFLKKILVGASALVVAPKLLLADKSHPADEFVKFAKEFSDKANQLKNPCTLEKPYVIELTNNFNTEYNNISIWGKRVFGKTSYFPQGITCDDDRIVKRVHARMHKQGWSFASSFKAGLIILESDNTSQVLRHLTHVQPDINDNGYWKSITPVIDPYQTASGAVSIRTSINFDEYTELVLSSILPKSSLKISIYPIDKTGDGINIIDVLNEKIYTDNPLSLNHQLYPQTAIFTKTETGWNLK